MNYVCGFLFSYDLENFVLIRKERGPENMAGKWNGVGGKILLSDTEIERGIFSIPKLAISREFCEETGVYTNPRRWHCFTIEEFSHTNAKIFYMAAFGDEYKNCKTVTDEEIRIFSQEDFAFLPRNQLVHNVDYLIQMVKTNMTTGYFMKLNPQGVNSR